MTKLATKQKSPSSNRLSVFSKVTMILGFAFLMFLVIVLGSLKQPGALAQSSAGSLLGFAWSDTIGWISFHCGSSGPGGTNICSTYNHRISVSSDGTLSGYAWSDNIGWISANSADLAGCPSAPCTARIDSNGALRGWLRALSGGTSQSGGWSGFISLSGPGYGAVRQSDGMFSGYAWGSTVIGWLSLNFAATDFLAAPTADLKVRVIGQSAWQDSLTIQMTDEIELGWNQSGSANTTSCQAVPPAYGFVTGGAISGIDNSIEEPIGNTSHTYRLLCYGSGSTQAVDTLVVTTTGGVGASFIPCSGQTSLPSRVPRGSDVNVCWELGTNDPAMCSINAGAATVQSPLPAVTGSVIHPMFGEVTFTLQCIGGDGDEMTVQVLPDIQET